MIQLIGRFHPVLVHLPIGILLVACLFHLLSRHQKFNSLRTALPLLYLLGALSAIASCVSGYLLSKQDDYNETLVGWHQWLGISTALVATLAWWLQHTGRHIALSYVFSVCIIVLISVTGHLGGSITHGADYLSMASDTDESTAVAGHKIANVQEAVAFTDVIQPILQQKCYSCHGDTKQKGKLRMDEVGAFARGGKSGPAYLAYHAEASEMVKRALLPPDNKKHMPPKTKPQLTDSELALLQWWINSGASFNDQVKSLPQPQLIKPHLAALQSGEVVTASEPWPVEPVEQADTVAIRRLKDAGAVVLPISKGSNYLRVSFINADTVQSKALRHLPAISNQLVELRLSNSKIDHAGLHTIGKAVNLRRLWLDGTGVTDGEVRVLQSLKFLRYLNLNNTMVSANGILQLSKLQALANLHLFHTRVDDGSWTAIQKVFPNTAIDSGGYRLQSLPGDTIRLTRATD